MNSSELEKVLQKTTKILAGEDVKVHTEGFAPRVQYDPATKMPTDIFIPALPENVDHLLVKAIHGFIDHECSHVMFSDSEHICDTTKGKLWHYIHNCIEDPRVNKAISEFYAGSAKNIKAGYTFLFEGGHIEDKTQNPYNKEYVDAIDLSDEKKVVEEQMRYSSLWFAKKMGDELSGHKYDELDLHRLFEPLEAKMDKRWLDLLPKVTSANDVKNCTEYFEGFFSKEAMEKMNPESGDGGGEPMSMEELEEAMGDALDSLEDELSKKISRTIEYGHIESSKGIHWTNRFDKFLKKKDITKKLKSENISVADYDAEVRTVTNYLNKDLRRLLEERRRRYYIGGYKSGKLNTKSLFSVRLGNDRIFKKKNEVRDINAAVSLLIDMSGSMSGSRISVAMQSAYSFAVVLDQLDVPYEIYGFTTENGNTHMRKEYNEYIADVDKRVESKIINIDCPDIIYAFKDFDDAFDVQTKRNIIAAGKGHANLIQNEDSKHVKMALERLAPRPERAKALFVFSDGQPAFHTSRMANATGMLKHLGHNSDSIYGVETFAIGIQNQSVDKFYKNYKVINNLSELPEALFSFLRKVI